MGEDTRVIPDERFSELHAGLLEIGQKGRQAGWDSVQARLAVDSLLAQAGVSREAYLATVDWLNEDLNRWRAVGERTERILEERAKVR